MKWCKKIFHENGNRESTGVAILILDKISFTSETITTAATTKTRRLFYKGINSSKDITILNINAHSTRSHKYVKKILTDLKEEIDNRRVRLRNFILHFQQWTDI